MRFILLKELVEEVLGEARIYGQDFGKGFKTSTEYDLSPEEIVALKGMTTKERQVFASKKLDQVRRSKGLCPQCGKNPPINKPNGSKGTYCQTCLDMFRAARDRLIKKRGSCARCVNPPIPGKKLCQQCTDELTDRRKQALASGTCIKCFKKPAESGMQVCNDCAKKKVDVEKLRRATNPDTEQERIRKRDQAYRAKEKAKKIGWDIEEAN